MNGGRVSEALIGPVCIRGIQVGEPLDVLFDAELRSVIGLEVVCRDGVHRFLPWSVGEPSADGVSISFSLALLDRPQLEYYREHALTLSRLRRLPVETAEASLAVEDVVVSSSGSVLAVVVDGADEATWIARDELVLERERLRHVGRRPAQQTAAQGAA